MSSETVAKTWRRVLAGGANAGDDEIIRRLERLEAWLQNRIALCRETVFYEPKPSIVINHMLDAIMRENRNIALVELRASNFMLRILNGETPEYGCGECTQANGCYDGSKACERRNP